MRLLNTHNGKLEWFDDDKLPRYAILSHVWDKHEQTFKDVDKLSRKIRTRVGSLLQPSLPQGLSAKLRGACEFAESLGFDWVWVDTCCIDKASSAELSEAINSMFAFYSSADVCIAYLADVPDDLRNPAEEGSDFWRSKWFTRGWTLQELIAPQKVLFVSRGWKPFGTKEEMAETLEAITGVNREVLTFARPVSSVSIAERMSWAAERVTTRREDRAYSLLGLFGVYMPTLYGEGVHAFRRLQEELLRSSPDQSLFAWGFSTNPSPNRQVATLFADSPALYAKNDVQGMSTITIEDIPKVVDAFLSTVRPAASASPEQPNVAYPIEYDTPAYAITNYGIRARVPVVRRATSSSLTAIVILAARNHSSYIGLVVHRLSPAATNHYAVGQRGYRLVRVGGPGGGNLSPPGWAHDLDLVHDDVMVRWEDIYITTTEPWLAQIRPAVADMPLRLLSGVPASDLNYFHSDQHHSLVTRRCLSLMSSSLRQDPCEIGDPSLRNEDVPDLASRIAQGIPEEVQHACKLWLTHLPLSFPDSELLQQLSAFARERLLHWTEALSLLGELGIALVGLPAANDWFSEHAPAEGGLFRDADRMIRAHRDILSTSTLQLYHGILVFDLPDCDLLHHPPPPKIKHLSRLPGWQPLLGRMKIDRDRVTSVALMPDNVHIVAGSGNGSVSLWNTRALARVKTFDGQHAAVLAVACSADGRLLAACGHPANVALWDIGTGAKLRVLAGQGHTLQAVAFSADGSYVAAGSDDNTARIWSVRTGETVRTLKGHANWVTAVAFSPVNSRVLASGSDDKIIKIWNIVTGEVVRNLQGHQNWLTSLAFSPDGSQIVSGSCDRTVKTWDAATGEVVRTIQGHSDHVTSVAFTSFGFCIVSSSSDGTIRKWDTTTGHCLSTFMSSQDEIVSCSVSQDGSRIASSSGEAIEFWDANTPSDTISRVGDMRAVSAVEFAPDGKTFVTSSWDSTVRVWETSVVELLRIIRLPLPARVVRFSPDGTLLATASSDRTIRLFDIASWKEVGCLARLPQLDPEKLWSLAFSPDGSRIACGTDHSVAAWDVGSRRCVAVCGVDHRVDVLAFSRDMMQIATGMSTEGAGVANVWDVASGQRVAALRDQPCIHSLRFSSDGRRVVSRGYDGGVCVNIIIPSWDPRESSSVSLKEAPVRFSWHPEAAGERSLGWLHFTAGAVRKSKPVCWLPAERRPHADFYQRCYAWHGNVVVVGSPEGIVTVLDLTDAVRSL